MNWLNWLNWLNWHPLAAAIIGLVLSWLARFPVSTLVKRVKENITVPSPSEALKPSWEELTNDEQSNKSGSWLGDLERALFFLALWFSAHEVVVGWFAFKVATKWEAWSNLGALPATLKDVEEIKYIISRRRWASQRLMSFLIGTAANVLAAFVSVAAAKYIVLPLIQLCFL